MESIKSKEEDPTKLDNCHKSSNNDNKLHADSPNCNINDSNGYDPSWLIGTSAEKSLNKHKKNDFSHPTYKKLSKINGKINKMNLDDLVQSLKELRLDTKGKKEVLVKRLKSYYKESSLKTDNVDESNHKTDKTLDYVCVIDFEATCTENKKFDYPHEIIQCLKKLKEDTFDSFCKPVINPKLTKFCTELTGITQEQVDSADEFPIVLKKIENWLQDRELGSKYRYAIATDGPWDMQNFLNLQCSHNDILYPYWAKKWIDVRKIFSNWFGVRRCGILKMLSYFGLEFEGEQHNGLDDAKNISRVLIHLALDGCLIAINSHIKNPLTKVSKKPTDLEISDDETNDSLGSENDENSEKLNR